METRDRRLMRFWLFKSEPSDWSWDDQVARGDRGEEWSGVRNYQARNFMREMARGDRGFFYHSQKDKAVVGIVEICATAHRDSTTDDDRWDCVDIRALSPLACPVTLAACKAEPALSGMALLKNPRLSVQPVSVAEWKKICAMGGIDPDTLRGVE
jgi:predicted RNA-binding protein with PUA-like domain